MPETTRVQRCRAAAAASPHLEDAMRLKSWMLGAFVWLSLIAGAYAEPVDIDAIKAADDSFYAALSGRDLGAMNVVWADRPYTINIGPRSKSVNVGSDAVTKYWERAFDFFSQISVAKANVRIQSNGSLAWVTGTETATLQPKAGGAP